MNPPSLKRHFHLFIGNIFWVSMFDFYWFSVLVNLAPFLGWWVVYFFSRSPGMVVTLEFLEGNIL